MKKNNKSHKLIIVGGPPGVGKTTVAERYVSYDNSSQQVSAGDLIRAIRAGKCPSKYYSAVQKAVLKKELVSPEIFSSIVYEKIESADKGVSLSLIDGFPYSEADWEIFNERIKETKVRIIGSIALNLSMELCLNRMSGRGVRDGESIRVQTNEEYDEFYLRRYDEYNLKKEMLTNLLLHSNVPIISICADKSESNILDEFKTGVKILKEGGDHES